MASIIPIRDPGDPRIAAYRDIRERDLVGREGHFIAEGAVVLKALLDSARHMPLSLLVAEKRIAALAPLLDGLAADVPVYSAGQGVLDGIAGFPLHRGILALGRRAALPTAEELLAGSAARALVVVLLAIANHDNMGGIFRNAAAFGATVILDAQCCDPLYRKAIRVSVGATLGVPYARLAPGEDGVALLRRHRFQPVALSPRGETPLAAFVPPPRVAAFFGAEGAGLPASLLTAMKSLRIPMTRGFDSLNVGTASGIVLHHLAGAIG